LVARYARIGKFRRNLTEKGQLGDLMQLKEFVITRIETIEQDETLQRAAEIMKQLDIGSLPVCNGGQLAGIITDRDIIIRAVANGLNPSAITVREIMSSYVVCCSEDDNVEEAARLMRENQVRRILVLNQADELVGITSLGELATITGDHRLAGEALASVSQESPMSPGARPAQDNVSDRAMNTERDDDLPGETKVTGIFHDSESAKKAIKELDGVGFAAKSILVAMSDEIAHEQFLRETQTQPVAAGEIPSLPSLNSEQILIMVEAEDRAEEALNILNSNHAITGGVRLPPE
jgi:CBS domain-containing protein